MFIRINGKDYQVRRSYLDHSKRIDCIVPNYENELTKGLVSMEVNGKIVKNLYPEEEPLYTFEGKITDEQIESLQKDPYQMVTPLTKPINHNN